MIQPVLSAAQLIRRVVAPAVMVGLLAGAAQARPVRHVAPPPPPPGDYALCPQAIEATEKVARVPPRLLTAIGIVESGRAEPQTGRVYPWPWTIDVNGAGRIFATKQEAIAAVIAAQQAGAQSIDVGCMQINLQHHPHAFATLDDAFDPMTNVRYAAAFLSLLYAHTSAWSLAVADYHSSTPELGLPYGQRVAALWPLASDYGMTAATLLPLAAAGPRVPVGPTPAQIVDPHHVMTAEFRAQLIQELRFRQERDAAMGLGAPLGSSASLLAQHARTGAGRGGRRLVQASLGG